VIVRWRAWRLRRAALRCIEEMHRRWDRSEKDDVFLAAEAWLWILADNEPLARVLLHEIGVKAAHNERIDEAHEA
jgi:hypothetical protein